MHNYIFFYSFFDLFFIFFVKKIIYNNNNKISYINVIKHNIIMNNYNIDLINTPTSKNTGDTITVIYRKSLSLVDTDGLNR